jgi:tRNA dimethylallyltransferase
MELAPALGAEIVSVDASTVYRGMDVGTAKPTLEQRSRVPHHMVDLAEATEDFSVARFQAEAQTAVRGVLARGRVPLLVGGSGLHFRAVVDAFRFPGTDRRVRTLLEAEATAIGSARLLERLASFDPAAASRIEPANVRRTIRALEVPAITGQPFSSFAVEWGRYPSGRVRAAGIEVPRGVLHRRIEERCAANWRGLVEETRRLCERGFHRFPTSGQAIGYAEAMACLQGAMGEDEAVARTVKRTKALARRQMAWFRRDPRIRWFAAGASGAPGIVDELLGFLRSAATGTAPADGSG